MTPDPLEDEIDAALEGVNLQDIGAETRSQKASGGERLYEGTIVGITGDDVFVELGPRSQGVVSLSEFEDPPEVGARMKFSMRGKDEDLILLSRREAQQIAAWEEIEEGSVVKARVSGQNTGGLELKVGPASGFMPASHVALRRVEDLSQFVGQTMLCEVLEVDRGKKRVLLSRKKVLEREAREQRERAASEMQTGQIVRGKVTRLEPFGAFVDIGGGLEGLVHVSNLSHRRVEHPEELLKLGDSVEAQILEIKEGGKRIGLGIKQLEESPWESLAARLPVDSVVEGKVVRLVDFGAFVEIEPGVEGLLHVSQMSAGRVARPREVVSVGETLSVRVQSIEPHAQRLSLSRLDRRGALLGSEEAVDDATIEEALESPGGGSIGTNLGDLFKKALKDKS